VIVEILPSTPLRIGIDGPVVARPVALVLKDDGTTVHADLRFPGDGISISPIGWWIGQPRPDWEAVCAGWRGERIYADKQASVDAEAAYLATLAQIKGWASTCTRIVTWTSGKAGCAIGLDATGAICMASHNAADRKATATRFALGDICKVGSYNFDYTGTVERITAKCVYCAERGDKGQKRFTWAQFFDLNLGWTTERAHERFVNWQD